MEQFDAKKVMHHIHVQIQQEFSSSQFLVAKSRYNNKVYQQYNGYFGWKTQNKIIFIAKQAIFLCITKNICKTVESYIQKTAVKFYCRATLAFTQGRLANRTHVLPEKPLLDAMSMVAMTALQLSHIIVDLIFFLKYTRTEIDALVNICCY